jgi:hypothetical protein
VQADVDPGDAGAEETEPEPKPGDEATPRRGSAPLVRKPREPNQRERKETDRRECRDARAAEKKGDQADNRCLAGSSLKVNTT